ncbi:tetraspanin-10 [Betta splendens]|uniref:Tetraspanin-10 n=1 Tax=Betta splendens TaxID=158456 RepID=A0A6P7NDY2_BETSP|nr:tetraspanin-10 [Betta splendens]
MRSCSVPGRFPRLWPRRIDAQHESSPLLPKAGSAKEGAAELASVSSDFHRTGSNYGQKGSEVLFGGTRRRYSFSLIDYLLKYFLVLCTLLFTVLGLLVLGLGMWGLISKESFAREKIGSIGTDPMLALLALGLLLALLCLSGCVGALRDNCCLLRLFSALVLALVAAEVLAAILAYGLRAQIGTYLRAGMIAAMTRYQDDLDLRFITDEIQTSLQCCGADTYRDWEVNVYYNCSAPGVLACGVPATCCVDPLENGTVWNSQCGVGARLLDEFSAQSVIFLGGCLGGISRWIEQHQNLMGTVALVVLGVQILTLFITSRLLDSIQWRRLVYSMES